NPRCVVTGPSVVAQWANHVSSEIRVHAKEPHLSDFIAAAKRDGGVAADAVVIDIASKTSHRRTIPSIRDSPSTRIRRRNDLIDHKSIAVYLGGMDLDRMLDAVKAGQWSVDDFDWSVPLAGIDRIAPSDRREAGRALVFTARLERQAANIFALASEFADDPR